MRLLELIEQYLAFRMSLGEKFRTNAQVLRAFGCTIGAASDVVEVRPEQASVFLAGSGPITSAWHARHNALLGFYHYAVSRGYVAVSPLPPVVPKRPPPFVPYIYSHQELRRLMDAADSYQRIPSCMEPITMRTIVLLLYAAGLRVREAIALRRSDVDINASLLTVRMTKFYKSRLVPFGPQLGRALAQYATRHRLPCPALAQDASFFTTRAGTPVSQPTIDASFRRMCKCVGIRRSDGGRYQPRLHDLRHTFAVHRLTSWYRQGLDVQKLLPHLSVYMGHVRLAATQVYLSMTPELLNEACIRFEHYAQEGHHD
jgi:integrase/recombinase XerD